MLREGSGSNGRRKRWESGNLPFDGRKAAKKTASSDYQLPSLDFLNEAQMRREQADDELLGMATKLAEKCREFNVTGQIKFICPGPVVTTYEFKPDSRSDVFTRDRARRRSLSGLKAESDSHRSHARQAARGN